METIVETNWLNKRIVEYQHLVKLGTISEEEAEKRIYMLEVRLEQLESESSKA